MWPSRSNYNCMKDNFENYDKFFFRKFRITYSDFSLDEFEIITHSKNHSALQCALIESIEQLKTAEKPKNLQYT